MARALHMPGDRSSARQPRLLRRPHRALGGGSHGVRVPQNWTRGYAAEIAVAAGERRGGYRPRPLHASFVIFNYFGFVAILLPVLFAFWLVHRKQWTKYVI